MDGSGLSAATGGHGQLQLDARSAGIPWIRLSNVHGFHATTGPNACLPCCSCLAGGAACVSKPSQAAICLNSSNCSDPAKYLSGLLLSLSTMLHLELPQVGARC